MSTTLAVSAEPDTMDDVSAPRSTHLVGRDAELETLVSTLGIRAPRAGRPAVLLGGDAGVGKTRLLTELRALRRGKPARAVAKVAVGAGPRGRRGAAALGRKARAAKGGRGG